MFGPVEGILDAGAGTGRGCHKLKARWPSVKVIVIEPAEAPKDAGMEGIFLKINS